MYFQGKIILRYVPFLSIMKVLNFSLYVAVLHLLSLFYLTRISQGLSLRDHKILQRSHDFTAGAVTEIGLSRHNHPIY